MKGKTSPSLTRQLVLISMLSSIVRLTRQQASLASYLRGSPDDPAGQAAVARDLGQVYRAWDVEVGAELKPFM